MLLICNESASPLDDLDFEWFGQMELTSSQGGKRPNLRVSDLFGPKILEGPFVAEGPDRPTAERGTTVKRLASGATMV